MFEISLTIYLMICFWGNAFSRYSPIGFTYKKPYDDWRDWVIAVFFLFILAFFARPIAVIINRKITLRFIVGKIDGKGVNK